MTLKDAKNIAFKQITGLNVDFSPINTQQEEIQDKACELMWYAACEELLTSISNGFKENAHRASYSDQAVFLAISETIKNFPQPTFKK